MHDSGERYDLVLRLHRSVIRLLQGVLVECIRGKGSAGVLVGCYLMALWQVPPDYIVNHLRLIRPITIETPVQEERLMEFHSTLVPSQYHVYANLDQDRRWSLEENYFTATAQDAPQEFLRA